MDETRIVETVRRLNTDFSELKLLEGYDMVMVSNGKRLAAVAWDPKTDRKLLQDFRCTSRLEEATWRESVGYLFRVHSLAPAFLNIRAVSSPA